MCLNVPLCAQSCPTLCNPMDCSLPGFSVHGIFQAGILEWVAVSFSRGSSWPRDWTYISCVSCIGRLILTTAPHGKPSNVNGCQRNAFFPYDLLWLERWLGRRESQAVDNWWQITNALWPDGWTSEDFSAPRRNPPMVFPSPTASPYLHKTSICDLFPSISDSKRVDQMRFNCLSRTLTLELFILRISF